MGANTQKRLPSPPIKNFSKKRTKIILVTIVEI